MNTGTRSGIEGSGRRATVRVRQRTIQMNTRRDRLEDGRKKKKRGWCWAHNAFGFVGFGSLLIVGSCAVMVAVMGIRGAYM